MKNLWKKWIQSGNLNPDPPGSRSETLNVSQTELDALCYSLSPEHWINPHKSLLGMTLCLLGPFSPVAYAVIL